jgi:uncharacterized membrane protein YheB (UPF0754 family)
VISNSHLLLGFDIAGEWRLLLIPLITGIIGYITNWLAIRLLFYPSEFVGIRIPGLKELAPVLPRRIRQIPGVLDGKFGWQGIIPSRSAKMGAIAAEKGVGQIADEQEFYEQFDPDRIAAHIVNTSSEEIRALTDEVLKREYPDIWENMPRPGKEFVHARVKAQLPDIAAEITENIGENIEQLLDNNEMITEYLDDHPEVVSRLFLEVGDRELRFIINSGFLIGSFLGVFSIPLFLIFEESWWVLPTCGMIVGYLTNWIALKIIFQPIHPRTIGPVELQGLFIKRQPIAGEKYAEIVADEIVTIGNVADNLMHGSQSDRTRKMIRDAIRPEVDRAVGLLGPLVRVTTGSRKYEQLREQFADEGVEQTMDPLQDPEFNEERSEVIKEWMTEKIQSLPPEGFVELLRPAFEEDEWMLILLGALLGLFAGWLQFLVVTAV